MKWYYVEDGKQAGPVDETEIPALMRAGKLHADTLVWREGMANWQPLNEAKPPGYDAAGAPAMGVAGTNFEAVCAECGKVFPKSEMIPHGSAHVCANCKPVFMQKLAEGAAIYTGQLNYASFGIRFAAVFLDGILLWIVNFLVGLAFGLSAMQAVGADPGGAAAVQIILFIVQMAIGISYEVFMIGKYGATLGKMACKIKVVTADGGRVSYARAFGRYFAKLLSGMICLIGYIMAAFDKPQHRALHDHICNTRVVVK